MRKVYYNPMLKLTLILPFLAASLLGAEQGAAQQPSSLKTTSLESHEGMTITARPWTDPTLYKEKFPKKSPFAAGIIAVQVVFRNDSDDSMKINLERIRLNLALSEEDHQALYPLSPEEAADVITHPSTKNVTSKRLPIPLGGRGPDGTRNGRKWSGPCTMRGCKRASSHRIARCRAFSISTFEASSSF